MSPAGQPRGDEWKERVVAAVRLTDTEQHMVSRPVRYSGPLTRSPGWGPRGLGSRRRARRTGQQEAYPMAWALGKFLPSFLRAQRCSRRAENAALCRRQSVPLEDFLETAHRWEGTVPGLQRGSRLSPSHSTAVSQPGGLRLNGKEPRTATATPQGALLVAGSLREDTL